MRELALYTSGYDGEIVGCTTALVRPITLALLADVVGLGLTDREADLLVP